MVSVGELVLVLGLLVSAHCEVRARDPDVEEEEEEGGRGRAVLRVGGAGFGGVPHYLRRFHHGATERPLLADRGTQPTRTGNWCAFEQQRVVTKAVKKTSPESHVVKSESPCPSGAPDCRIVMYKLSPRTFYEQVKSVQTDHLWRCCPGHGGRNCEDTVPGARRDSGSSTLIGRSEAGRSPEELHTADVHTAFRHQHGDPNREQNDHQPPASELQDVDYLDLNQNNTTTQPPTQEPSQAHNPHHTPYTHKPHRPPHRAADPYDHEHSIHHPPHLATDFYEHDHSYHHPPDRTADSQAHNPQHPPHRTTDSHTHNPQHPPVRTTDSHTYNPQHPPVRTTDSHTHNPQHPPHRTADSHTYNPQHPPHRTADSDDHDRTNRQQEPPLLVVDLSTAPLPEGPPVLPAPHMMALIMSQLHPILQSFNHSVEQLRRQVEVLAEDVTELKSNQLQAELQAELEADLRGSAEREEEAELEVATRQVEEVKRQVEEVRRLMESQRSDMENRLHSQHMMLHYNISSLKMDVDVKLKRHQKMLQVSLQDMNATLTELKQDQEQDQDQGQVQVQDQDQGQVRVPEVQLDFFPPPSQVSDSSALWEAIERLDNMVVNNTVKVGGLLEDVDVTSGGVQQLRQEVKELSEQMNQTARSTQIQYMLTGLEVEEAKVEVLGRVEELAGNVSQHGQRFQELDSDVDYLYTAIYRHNNSSDCNCGALKANVARLERGVANVTELANENRLLLDESDGGGGGGGAGGDWELAVEALRRGLQQVNEHLTSEKSRSRTVEMSLSQLRDSVVVSSSQISELQEHNKKVDAEMIRLYSSFRSLLKDAIRHSDVLELLLGEEVLEFLDWQLQDQEAYSIPALKEQLTLLQEQWRGNEENMEPPQGHREEREEQPSADQPSSSSTSSRLPGTMRRSSDVTPARERQLLLLPERRPPPPAGDGSDLWNLEQTVEELQLKVLTLEERQKNASGGGAGGVQEKLQAEVTWLKRGLEEHLKVFKNVFSNADVLVGSDATLELDKLWQLLRNKEKKRGGGGGGGGGREESERGNHRSRREVTGVPLLSGQSDASLLFLAGSPRSSSDGFILFRSFLNHARFHAGAFTAPADGIYLFVLTLHLQAGSAHVSLLRGGARAGGGAEAPVSLLRGPVTEAGPVTAVSLLLLRQGEELRPHLSGGTWEESEDNVFAGLLLHRTA